MNSIKNLLVVVMLMGVSYGAFQVINSPDPTLSDDVPDIEELDIDIGPPLADDFSATMPGDPGALTGEAIQFAGEPSDGLPALPPGLQGAADPSTGPGLELPELEITSPPTTATSQSTTPPPAHNSGLDMPPASAMAGLPTGNSGMGFNSGQFQPGPQTELQPVNPKPLADLANRQLNQLGAAVENQASQVVDTANQLAHQQLQPARDAATELQGQMNQFNEQATEFLAKTQNQLSTGGFSPPADPSRAWRRPSPLPRRRIRALPRTLTGPGSASWPAAARCARPCRSCRAIMNPRCPPTSGCKCCNGWTNWPAR